MSLSVAFPSVALVYAEVTGQIRRKVIPAFSESALFDVLGGENYLILRGPPYDDATCKVAIRSILGSVVS